MPSVDKVQAGTVWVWCQTCKRKGLVNRKLGIRGTIQACSACQNGETPETSG